MLRICFLYSTYRGRCQHSYLPRLSTLQYLFRQTLLTETSTLKCLQPIRQL